MISEPTLRKIWSALRKANNAHWRPPSFKDVKDDIDSKGEFVFTLGDDPWVAKLIITEHSTSYIVNESLPDRMLKQAKAIKKKFEDLMIV